MFMRKVLQISRRLPNSFLWQVQRAAYCNKHSGEQSDTVNKCPLHAIRLKEAEEYLANLDEDGLKKMEEIKLLMEILRFENKQVPDEVPVADWKRLITEHLSYTSRVKFLKKLRRDELRTRELVLKKQQQAKIRQEKMESHSDFPKVSLNIPRRKEDMKSWNGIQALKSDIKTVIDLDFEQNSKDEIFVMSQIQLIWSRNLKHLQPLNIHLTSVSKNSRLKQLLEISPSVFVTRHEENFTDIFPREDLVYLSPDGPPMTGFDPSCTYIIGGIANRCQKSRMTLDRARELGIRCASFPLRKYCNFGNPSASADLTVNCSYGIVQDMYLHHSWATAFHNNLNSAFHMYEDTSSNRKSEGLEKQFRHKLKQFKKYERSIEAWKV